MKDTPRHFADQMRARKDADGFMRETFILPRPAARLKAREVLDRFPTGGCATIVERWRQIKDGRIEFTMRRLQTAD